MIYMSLICVENYMVKSVFNFWNLWNHMCLFGFANIVFVRNTVKVLYNLWNLVETEWGSRTLETILLESLGNVVYVLFITYFQKVLAVIYNGDSRYSNDVLSIIVLNLTFLLLEQSWA